MMVEVAGDDVSLYEVASTLFANWMRIATVAVVGVLLAVLPALLKRSTYTSSTTIISARAGQNADARLRGLASQFGLGNITDGGTTSPTASPAFLVKLAASPVILEPIVLDSVDMPEDRGRRRAIID